MRIITFVNYNDLYKIPCGNRRQISSWVSLKRRQISDANAMLKQMKLDGFPSRLVKKANKRLSRL